MDSIITQVNREDEQLNAFANDKGKDSGWTATFQIIVQIFVLMKKKVLFLSGVASRASEQPWKKQKSNSCV